MDHHRAGHPSRVSRTHPSAPLTSPAARRRWNPNPSPPSWGGGGPQPAGGRRPQAARHQTPVARAASCRLARALGRVRGRGAFGPPSGGRDQPKENHGRAPDRGPPPPRRRAAGGGPAGGGRIRRRRRHGRRQGRQPHAKAATASDRATAPTAERPGGGAAAPRTPAASNETGRRPTTGRGPRRQPPAHTNGGEGPRAGAGQGRAAAMGRGRPGRASTGPACTRPAAYILCPSPPPLGAGGDNRHGGGPARRALCARDSGRAEGPRGGRIRTRFYGAGGCRFGTGWGGRIEAGAVPPGRGAASAAKKMAGGLAPPAGHDWTKKNAGRTLCPPPLAVTADTRYPPVRRSSPKRTRCRPVPYALAVRRLLHPPSCLP